MSDPPATWEPTPDDAELSAAINTATTPPDLVPTRLPASTTPSEPVPASPDATAVATIAAATAGRWWAPLETAISPWLEELVAVWCFGVLLFAMRPAWSWCLLRRLRRAGVSAVPEAMQTALVDTARRLGVRREVRLLQSTLVSVPMVVGYLRPVILLPLCVVSGFSASEIVAILAHELAHIRRHDYLANLLQTLVETVCFYHPAVWWLSSRIRQEREHCCDELAAHALGSRATYGRALLALEELRGTAPVLSLGANSGSLLERVRRLAESDSQTGRARGSGVVSIALLVMVIAGIGAWTASDANERGVSVTETEGEQSERESADALPENEQTNRPTTQRSFNDENDPHAKELALRAHAQVASIAGLPRFRVYTKVTHERRDRAPNDDAEVLDALKGLLESVDRQTERYMERDHLFAWDSERLLESTRMAYREPSSAGGYGGGVSRQVPGNESPSEGGGLPIEFQSHTIATREFTWSREQSGSEPARFFFQTDAAYFWQHHFMDHPDYLRQTPLTFWWGDNCNQNQAYSPLPVADASYRMLGMEQFDGEPCDVVESWNRHERLWISQRTGLIRAFMNFLPQYPSNRAVFYDSDSVKQVAGRTFSSSLAFANWHRNEFPRLPAEKKRVFRQAMMKDVVVETMKPLRMTRYRDFREIAPGVLFPFRQDRAVAHSDQLYFNRSLVVDVRTDVDLSERLDNLRPKKGDPIQDQRFAVVVDYTYDSDRSREELLRLVNAENQKHLQQFEDGKASFVSILDDMVGTPAPPLPTTGWVGGDPPQIAGRPYLVHFWASWSNDCKQDFAQLKTLASQGANIIGMHPSGVPVRAVVKTVQEQQLPYPSHVAPYPEPIGGFYYVGVFPYCILVDAEGQVAAHGNLFDENAGILAKFRELLTAATADKPTVDPNGVK